MTPIETAHRLLAEADYEPVDGYGMVGDCRSAALISRSGSVDWLCLPDFASPSLFAALVDRRRGGRFLVSPRAVARTVRRYAADSAVLETHFECTGGRLRLTDAMPLAAGSGQPQRLLRLAECTAGEVALDIVCQPRPDYGTLPSLQPAGENAWLWRQGGGTARLQSDFALAAGSEAVLAGGGRLRAGERCRLELAFAIGEAPAADLDGLPARLAMTLGEWRAWARQCRYRGPYADAVRRSAVTLKLLCHAGSGAIVASPSAALPEDLAADRNWDYRYGWLRDASLFLQSFMDLGYEHEAKAFMDWLLGVEGGAELAPCYGTDGRPAPAERLLAGFEGYRGCGPVRVGNAAGGLTQLDVYGEAVHAAARYVARRGRLAEAHKVRLAALGTAVCRRWRQPDPGLWEVRTAPRQHTHSWLMAWVALDRLIALRRPLALALDEIGLRRERERIRQAIEHQGYHPEIGSYVGYVGGTEADASLLLMARYGYGAPDEPRIRGTWRHLSESLGQNGFLRRYPAGYDGLPGGDRPFAACSFWAVDYLARAGDPGQATRRFERLLAAASELGLYGEQFDGDGRPLGNFPHAGSHAGLITAALALEQAARGWKGQQIAA